LQEAVHLNEVLLELEGFLQVRLGEEIELRIDTAPGLWQLHGDRQKVEKMLGLIVATARDLMPRGGHLSFSTSNWELRPTAEHLVYPPGNYVRLTVVHNGSVTEETAGRIGEEALTGGRQGPGSDMARLYGLVQAAGGYVLFRSLKGRGATLDVCLPADRELGAHAQDWASMRRNTI
jgi:signal transduction histidine kinase